MDDISIGFIGFGLIGGSIAKAIKEKHPGCRLVAYNYHDTPNESLNLAKTEHVLDEVYETLTDGFGKCDLVFLCAPVLRNIAYLKQLKSIMKPACILTDVGSVKGNIHTAVTKLDLEANFIGGHPMAGSEKTGYESSNAKIMENAFYILTPTAKTPKETVTFMTDLVNDMNAIPVVLDSKEHDDATAAISHVPHIIAASLVNMVRDHDNKEGLMREIAAGGFKDITRIASSSAIMWQSICLSNTDSITKFLTYYIDSLTETRKRIEDHDADYLSHLFEKSKEYRDSIPNRPSGIIKKIYEVYVDIIDEAGAIATIATILASNGISIKNIGIIHNREFEEGVLRIEFYEEEPSREAVELLTHYHYTIYQR